MATKTLSRNAGSIMNPHAPFLSPEPVGRDMAVQLVSGLFTGIPVVHPDGFVLGIVTQGNLDWVRDQGEDFSMVPAEQMLTVLPVYLHEHMTIDEVGEKLIQTQVMQLPVVREGKFLGVITHWMVFGKEGLSPYHFTCIGTHNSEIRVVSDRQDLPEPSTQKSQLMREPKTLLVVDDDAVIAGLLCDLLADLGYRVMSAGHGKQGLSIVRENLVDGLLLDLEMPVMDGVTMLDELRWENYDLPVVVMSGGADHSTLQNLLQEGAQGCLMKPFTLKTLEAQCERVFGPANVSPPFMFGPDWQNRLHLPMKQTVKVGSS